MKSKKNWKMKVFTIPITTTLKQKTLYQTYPQQRAKSENERVDSNNGIIFNELPGQANWNIQGLWTRKLIVFYIYNNKKYRRGTLIISPSLARLESQTISP